MDPEVQRSVNNLVNEQKNFSYSSTPKRHHFPKYIVIVLFIGALLTAIGSIVVLSTPSIKNDILIPNPSKQASVPTQIPTPISRNNGVTQYTFSTSGLTIEYPSHLVVKELSDASRNPEVTQAFALQLNMIKQGQELDEQLNILIEDYDNPNRLPLKQFLISLFSNSSTDPSTNFYTQMDQQGIQEISTPVPGTLLFKGFLSRNPTKLYAFSHEDHVLLFTLTGLQFRVDYSPDAEKIFDDIILSSKFE